jgi:hypothetical protein
MKCITFDLTLDGVRTSQFKNYNFNSMVKFGGTYLGANNHGIFELVGSKDNTSIITAEFAPVTTDFGISSSKRLYAMYLGLETDDDLLVQIYADEVLVKTYTLTAKKTGQQRIRKRIGWDAKGRYWSFIISNPKGNHFAIDAIDILPQTRHASHDG